MGIKLTLKQIGLLATAGVVFILLAVVGFQSKKLKKLATKLMKKTGDMELQSG